MHSTEPWIKHLQRKSRGFLLLLLVEMHPLDAYFATIVLSRTSGHICRINAVCLCNEYPVAFVKLQGKGIQALCSPAVCCVAFQDVPSMTFRDQEYISTHQNLGWMGSTFFFSVALWMVRVHISAEELMVSGYCKFMSLTDTHLGDLDLQVLV